MASKGLGGTNGILIIFKISCFTLNFKSVLLKELLSSDWTGAMQFVPENVSQTQFSYARSLFQCSSSNGSRSFASITPMIESTTTWLESSFEKDDKNCVLNKNEFLWRIFQESSPLSFWKQWIRKISSFPLLRRLSTCSASICHSVKCACSLLEALYQNILERCYSFGFCFY